MDACHRLSYAILGSFLLWVLCSLDPFNLSLVGHRSFCLIITHLLSTITQTCVQHKHVQKISDSCPNLTSRSSGLFLWTMETADNSSSKTTASDQAVSEEMQKGLQDMLLSTGAGLVVGGLTGIVLARGGGSGIRKMMTGFGGGAGLGASWQRCSISLEALLSEEKSK
mmetsp:Transcript_11952/g.27667  ORF Transcript_11952/g.27667 Transcript_11952/m.27667 type:complete len:168 (-) Transcript_11952:114-617(-)